MLEHIGQVKGFTRQGLQFREHGVLAVDLRLHPPLIADASAVQQANAAQCIHFFFQGSGGSLRLPGQFAQMDALIRVHQQPGQHLAARLVGKQQVGKRRVCFQLENNRS